MLEQVFANLATGFSAQFGGPYHAGEVVRQSPATFDTGGSITAAGAVLREDCRVQGDAATQAMRSAPDFLETDARLLILGPASLDTSALIVLATGPHVGTWGLLSVTRDPAGIGWECRARRLG